MRLHRIGTKTYCGTPQGAFGGQGSLYGDGRWHHRGRLIVYTASHRSLALLELIVRLDRKNQIQPHVAWEIEVPNRHVAEAGRLPKDWQTNLAATRTYGDAWLAAKTSAALRVPSVIVPSEINVLINPAHPAFDLGWIKNGPHAVEIDHGWTDSALQVTWRNV